MKITIGSLAVILLLCGHCTIAQHKYERKYRILKSQFPKTALELIDKKLEGAKKLKFYKETDSIKSSFEARFKKDRLWYNAVFDENGKLGNMEILIKPIDIPSETFLAIERYVKKAFSKYRLKEIWQQYPTSSEETLENTLKNTFQNLIIPSITYKIMVAGKKSRSYLAHEIQFNAQGELLNIHRSLPPNYDHVLY
ncbi:hypothetical protein [Maribacter sp. 2304DJ31-5]|uniref:hypothetical protein n=1 Tax=Maribacter sp. 2304DJ31-5 TaxID=3386273 RepID=UPI0039BD0B72